MNNLPWSERVAMLSIHPDAASREDVARLAAELMEAKHLLAALIAEHEVLRKVRSHRRLDCDCESCRTWRQAESILEKQR